MQKPPTATDARPRPSATPGILLLGLPLVIASAVALGFLFHAVGIHQRKEPALSGLIAIIVGTRVLVVNQEKFRYPSRGDRKSTRLNSSHSQISYAVFCLKKK